MSSTQKTLVGSMAVLLMAFVVFGVFTWVRVLQVIPYSSSCATTLVQISRQSAAAVHFFSVRSLSAHLFLSFPVVSYRECGDMFF
jgi:hypothetical protein